MKPRTAERLQQVVLLAIMALLLGGKIAYAKHVDPSLNWWQALFANPVTVK